MLVKGVDRTFWFLHPIFGTCGTSFLRPPLFNVALRRCVRLFCHFASHAAIMSADCKVVLHNDCIRSRIYLIILKLGVSGHVFSSNWFESCSHRSSLCVEISTVVHWTIENISGRDCCHISTCRVLTRLIFQSWSFNLSINSGDFPSQGFFLFALAFRNLWLQLEKEEDLLHRVLLQEKGLLLC